MSQPAIQPWLEALAALPARIRDANSIEKPVSRGEFIYRAGNQPQALYLIREGLVGASLISPRGSQHLLRLFHSGDYFGHRSLFANQPYHVDSLCLEDASLVQINKTLVFTLGGQHPELLHNLAHTLALQLGVAELLRVDMQEKLALQRVAEALVYLLDLDPEHRWTRREIAEFCSTTTETVIRCIGNLTQLGLVGRGRKLRVLDRPGLIAFAGGR